MPPQPIGVALALHNRPIRHGSAAHEEGDTDDALVADHGDFGRRAILHDVKHGHDAGRGEIGVIATRPQIRKGHRRAASEPVPDGGKGARIRLRARRREDGFAEDYADQS